MMITNLEILKEACKEEGLALTAEAIAISLLTETIEASIDALAESLRTDLTDIEVAIDNA